MEQNETSAHFSLACAALLLPLTMFIGTVLGYILKRVNPAGVNIKSDLAYLAPILIASMVCFGIIFFAGLISGMMALKTPAKQLAKLSLELLVAEGILTVLILVLRQATTNL